MFDNVNRIGANGRVLAELRRCIWQLRTCRTATTTTRCSPPPDAAKPAGTPGAGYEDPRYQMGDIFNPGFEGRFTVGSCSNNVRPV